MWRRWSTPQNLLLAFIDELWKTQKIRISKKWKKQKIAGISSFYTSVPKSTMRYSSWDTEWEKYFLSFWAIFCPLIPPWHPRKPIFWKKEKIICRCHHFKLAPQKTTKWCLLTQIWSATDITFCHFIQFFTLLPHYWSRKLKFGKSVQNTWWYYSFTYVHHKSHSWCMVPDISSMTDKIDCHFGLFFCPLTIQKIKILKKWK